MGEVMPTTWLYPEIVPCAVIGGQINYRDGAPWAAYCPPGAGTWLGQWGDTPYYNWYRLLWKWPLGGIPAGQKITGAVLHIYYGYNYGGGTKPQYIDTYHITTTDPGDFPQAVLDINDWDTGADLIQASWGGFPVWGGSYGYKTLDVTDFLKSDYDAGKDWFPIRLRGVPEDTDLTNWVYVTMYFNTGSGPRPDGTSGALLPLIEVESTPASRGGLNPGLAEILLG
ncbi:MAG: hypothetical protein RX318_11880 [bacterium]|nr:hypothetical protein [bacterium]